MPAMEKLCQIIGLPCAALTEKEYVLLENDLFLYLYDELVKFFKPRYEHYRELIKTGIEKEIIMFEKNFLRYLIKDILITDEYSIEGIAYYIQVPEDIICDIMIGKNLYPSLQLFKKIINLHKSVRPDLYKEISKKILSNIYPNPQLYVINN